MQYITVATPPFGDIHEFDRVVASVGGPAEGMVARYAGATADGSLRVVTLWESKAHADRFFTDRLGPALAEVLAPEPVGVPEATGIEVSRAYSSQLVS
jgi:hypothetical protein